MKRVLSCLAVLSVLSGCNLNAPSVCLPDQERCVDTDMGTGLYYVCGVDGKWSLPTACKSDCDENRCAEFVNSRSCDDEGAQVCIDDEAVSLSLVCRNHQWIVTPCIGACVKDECVNSNKSCENDDKQCVYVEPLNLSYEMECIDRQWITKPCANGVSCEGEQCMPAPFIECTEPNGHSCKGKDTWTMARCRDGQCIPEKCKDTYMLSNGDCYAQAECCGDECVNCDRDGMVCTISGECGSCAAPNVVCNGVCINPTTSHDFCGADQGCEHYATCDEEMLCSYDADLGRYACVCDGKTICDNVCYDLSGTLEHCGSCETDCSKLEGWKAGGCVDGRCQASECIEPYQLATVTVDGNEVSTCVDEGKVECGADVKVDCAVAVDGWQAGHCETVDVSGEQQEICVIDTCLEGYHIYENTCEADGPEHCGDHESTCTTSDIPGSVEVSCGTGSCLVVSCDETHLLSENSCLSRECQEEETRCINDTDTFIGRIQKCTDNMWVEDSVCANDVSCKDTDSCGDCLNGQKQCKDNQLEICSQGLWILDTECVPTIEGAGATCDPETGCGNECPNDNPTVCVGACVDTQTNILHCGGCDKVCHVDDADNSCNHSECSYTCHHGFTDNGIRCCPDVSHGSITKDNSDECHFSCETDYIISDGSCVKANCKEDETRCVNGSDNVGEMQKCTQNTWVRTSICENEYSCNGDETVCSTVCQNTIKRCTDNGDNNVDSIQTCIDGDWGAASECTTGVENALGACDGEHSCGKYKCKSGYKDTGTTCVLNALYCETNGSSRCTSDKMQDCVNHVWTDRSGGSCGGNSCDSSGTACGECQNGSKKCATNVVTHLGTAYICSGGSWGSGTSCGSNSCNGSVCGECQNTTQSCTNSGNIGQIKTCSDGVWGAVSNCPNDYSCVSSATCSTVCQNGTTSCSNGTGNIGTVKTCSNGAWNTGTSCNTVSCSGNECGSCVNNTSECTSSTQYHTCSGGLWGIQKTCTAPTNGTATCSDGSCEVTCDSFMEYNGKVCCSGKFNAEVVIDKSLTCHYNCTSGTNCGTSAEPSCVNTNTNRNHCGSCNNACKSGQICKNGKCQDDTSICDTCSPIEPCCKNKTTGMYECGNSGNAAPCTLPKCSCISGVYCCPTSDPDRYTCNSSGGTGCIYVP